VGATGAASTVPGPTGATGPVGATGPTGAAPTLKTVNYQSLIGAGNVTIETPRSRVYGRLPNGNAGINIINFGAILTGGTLTIDVDIMSYLSTYSGAGSIKLYASQSPSSVVGALLLATYTIPGANQNPGTGRFIRRFWTYENSGSGEDGGYADYYIVGADPNVSLLSDVVTTFNQGQVYYGNYNYIYTYLVATASSNTSATGAPGFIAWSCEYGYN
jgi:hypothetical protein